MGIAAAEPSSGVVFASLPMALFGYAQTLGLSFAELLSISKLSESDLSDPDAFVPYECLLNIWTELLRRFPDVPLGLRYAEMLGFEALGVLGYAIRHAKHLQHALELQARFAKLADPYFRVEWDTDEGRTVLRLEHEPRVVAMREPVEMMLGTMVRCSRELAPRPVHVDVVCFRHPRRHDLALYREFFGADCEIRFDAAFTGVEIDEHLLTLPLSDGDPRIARFLTDRAEGFLGQLPDVNTMSLTTRAQDALRDGLLTGQVDAAVIAKKLGTSARTLQRGLKAEGTSLSELCDRVRQEIAFEMLSRPQHTLAEVAFSLGYADPRAFYRSFKRWTGQTPAEYRVAQSRPA